MYFQFVIARDHYFLEFIRDENWDNYLLDVGFQTAFITLADRMREANTEKKNEMITSKLVWCQYHGINVQIKRCTR